MVEVKKQSEKKFETSNPAIEFGEEDNDRESDQTRNSGVAGGDLQEVQDGDDVDDELLLLELRTAPDMVRLQNRMII